MSFWASKPTSKLSVVCDIGSASVAVGLVLFEEGKLPNILYTIRVPISIIEKPDSKGLELSMARFFEEALKKFSQDIPQRAEYKELLNKTITDVYAIYSSPWYVSKTSTIRIEKSKPFLLDRGSINRLINEEEQEFEAEAVSGKYDSIIHKDIKMIERELVRVKLNGYETSDPFLKEISHAELSLYMSLIPHTIFAKLEELSEKYLHTRKVSSFTFPLVSFGAVRDLFPHESDFILLDIAGEMTDASVVVNGVITNSSSFSLGRNSLIRKIKERFGVSYEIALSYIDMLVSDSLEEGMAKEVKLEVDIFNSLWLQTFNEASIRLKGSEALPTKIFLTIDEDVSSVFKKNFDKTGVDNSPIWSVTLLTPLAVSNKVSYGKFVFPDPFISLESIFIFKKGKHG
jgi:hypothetical protein